MTLRWQPQNLTETCPATTQLSACTYFGLYFLDLLVKLYGGSQEQGHGEPCRYGDEYDFIVVGAGSAGCVVASRLSENTDWRVLLLEAGPEQPDITLVPGMTTVLSGSNIDWGYSTVADGVACLAQKDGRCGWSRGKVMGGSGSINTMVYIRGSPEDFDGWARNGNEGWSYKDVLPYFIKMENNLDIENLERYYHGVGGPQSVSRFPYIDAPSLTLTEAFNQIGLPLVDFNGAKQVGTMQTQAFSVRGQRYSTNSAYIQPIRYRKNLIVQTESEVTKILIDASNTAYGVKYVRNGYVCTAFAKKEVIVSGGAINSPKLLLLSGIGPKEHLNDLNIPVVQDLPVGRNLQDHLTFEGLIIAFDNKTSTTVSNYEMVKQVIEYRNAKVKQGPLSSTGPYNSVSFFKTEPTLRAPDIQIQTQSIVWREYFREPVAYATNAIFPTVYYDAVMPRLQNLEPYSRGVLLLNASNPNGPPLMYANYFQNRNDLIPIKKGMKRLLELEKTRPFQDGRAAFIKKPLEACKDTLWGSDEYVDCMTAYYTFPLNHQVGTCKMGPRNDTTAVVDPKLNVIGVTALRVIDASIMPKVVHGNTHAPTIMIAEMGSDFIKDYWTKCYTG